MEPVTQLHINLPRIRIVRPAESLTVIQQKPPVGHVERMDGEGPVFSEGLAQGDVDCFGARQVCGALAVQESGTIADIPSRIAMPGEQNIESNIECMALIVVQKEVVAARREIGQSTADSTLAFSFLTGVSQRHLAATQETRRTEHHFQATDTGPLNGQGKKDVGVPQNLVIKGVLRAGTKVIDVNHPFLDRKGQAELVLLR